MNTSFLKRAFNYLVYFCLFLTPIIFIPAINLSYALPKVVVFRSCVMLMLLLYVFRVLIERKAEILSVFLRRDVKILMLSFLGVLALGILASKSPTLSFWGSYYRMMGGFMYFHLFLFFLLLVLNFHTKEQWKRAIEVLATGVIVIFLYSFIKLFGFNEAGFYIAESAFDRIVSTFGQPNYLGGYMVMMSFLTFAYYLLTKKKWVLVVVGLSILSLVMSESRAALLGVFSGLWLFTFLYGRRFEKKKMVFWSFFLPVVLLILFFAANHFEISRLNLKEHIWTIEVRKLLWSGTLELIEESPLVGHGFETFGLEFQRHFDSKLLHLEDIKSVPDRSHNLFLDVLAANGVFGLMLLIYGLYTIFKIGIGILKEDEKAIYAIGVLSSIFGVFVSLLFGFMVTELAVLMTFLLAFLAFLGSKKTVSRDIEFLEIGSFRWLVGVFAVLYVVLAIFFQNGLVLYADYLVGSARGIEDLQDAVILHPNQTYYNYILSAELRDAGEFELAHFYADRSGKFVANRDGLYFLSKGKIHLNECIKGDSLACRKGEMAFKEAFKRMPFYPPVSLNWGRLWQERGDCGMAMEKFNYYLDILPGFWKNYGTEEYKNFYYNNPSFNKVFDYMAQC